MKTFLLFAIFVLLVSNFDKSAVRHDGRTPTHLKLAPPALNPMIHKSDLQYGGRLP